MFASRQLILQICPTSYYEAVQQLFLIRSPRADLLMLMVTGV